MEIAAVEAAFPELGNISPLGDPDAGQKKVFAAEYEGAGLALKLVRVRGASGALDPEDSSTIQSRLEREMDILAHAHSPHLPGLSPLPPGLREVDGDTYAYFGEELIEGEAVSQILKRDGAMPVTEVAQMAADVATALEIFRGLRKVHRDVKPANIMRRASGRYVLIDPGYALDLAGPSLTKIAGIPGTAAYMSPEQTFLGGKRSLDFRSDLYSLGVVMFEALAGEHPYRVRGMTEMEVVEAARSQEVVPLLGLGPEANRLWPVVMRLLKKRIHLRYNSVSAVIGTLNEQFDLEGEE